MSLSNKIVFAGKTMDPQPLNGIDLLFCGYPTHAFLYDHVLDETVLIKSLKKNLMINPYFSGRLKNMDTSEPIITACDSGVLFSIETLEEEIQSFTSNDAPYLNFVPLVLDEYTPLLQIKLLKYYNGSVLKVSYSHIACDGNSFFDFLNSWGRLARGESCRAPIFDRVRFREQRLGNGETPSENFPVVHFNQNQFNNFTKGDKQTFRLKYEFIKKLVRKIKSDEIRSKNGISDSIWMAYIWKLIVSNRISNRNKVTFSQIYNSRPFLGLNRGYFGDALIYPFFEVEKEQLEEMSLESIAVKILKLRNDLIDNADELRKDIAYWDARVRDGSLKQRIYEVFTRFFWDGEILFNNLTKQPIYNIDFGSGQPVWTEFPGREYVLRNLHAFPAPEKNGDIILFITLPEIEMKKLTTTLTPI